jgi:hypothetical protein
MNKSGNLQRLLSNYVIQTLTNYLFTVQGLLKGFNRVFWTFFNFKGLLRGTVETVSKYVQCTYRYIYPDRSCFLKILLKKGVGIFFSKNLRGEMVNLRHI